MTHNPKDVIKVYVAGAILFYAVGWTFTFFPVMMACFIVGSILALLAALQVEIKWGALKHWVWAGWREEYAELRRKLRRKLFKSQTA